jgi:hypothetical protein
LARLSSIRVPKIGLPVLKRLAELDEKHASSLTDRLSDAQFRSAGALVSTVQDAVGDTWDEDESDAFVTHLISMSTLATSHDFGAGELAEHLTEQISSDLGEAERKTLPTRLAALLSAPSFAAFGKAIDIARESDRLLHVSRVITDLRPVFSEEVANEPLGAVIVHTLRLDYFEENDVKTISFALNSRDLAQLKRTVERAQAKENTLSGLLKRVELAEFDLSGDTDDKH